ASEGCLWRRTRLNENLRGWRCPKLWCCCTACIHSGVLNLRRQSLSPVFVGYLCRKDAERFDKVDKDGATKSSDKDKSRKVFCAKGPEQASDGISTDVALSRVECSKT